MRSSDIFNTRQHTAPETKPRRPQSNTHQRIFNDEHEPVVIRPPRDSPAASLIQTPTPTRNVSSAIKFQNSQSNIFNQTQKELFNENQQFKQKGNKDLSTAFV
jgi:hypothetical protein